MADRVRIENLVMVVAGVGAIILGILTIVFRKGVAARNRRNIENSVSERVFPGLSAGSTPARMVPVGIVLMMTGAAVAWRGLTS